MRYAHYHQYAPGVNGIIETGFIELNPFPCSNQIVVSNHAFIKKEFRGKGLGKEQHRRNLERAHSLGYDYIMCTVRADNSAQIHILASHGWKKLDGFRSSETEHDIEIWGRLVGTLTETHIQP